MLAGCAAGPAPQGAASTSSGVRASTSGGLARYRCEQGVEFTARFADDSAVLDAGARGKETLLRDAGGVTPQQSVYSSNRLRAEFGLGSDGKQAVLHYLAPALELRCILD
jgi:hypothetical protein